MSLPLYAYLPVVAGVIAGIIGGRIYKRNQREKAKRK